MGSLLNNLTDTAMSLKQTLDRFSRLDYLIRHRATGTPEELAEKLGITRSTWFRLKEELTLDLGLPIAYDPLAQTYYYTETVQVVLTIKTNTIENQTITPPQLCLTAERQNRHRPRATRFLSQSHFLRLAARKFEPFIAKLFFIAKKSTPP